MIINRVFKITCSSPRPHRLILSAPSKMPLAGCHRITLPTKPPDKSQPPCAGPIVTTAGQWENDQQLCWLSNGCIISSIVIKCFMLCTMSSKKCAAHTHVYKI